MARELMKQPQMFLIIRRPNKILLSGTYTYSENKVYADPCIKKAKRKWLKIEKGFGVKKECCNKLVYAHTKAHIRKQLLG